MCRKVEKVQEGKKGEKDACPFPAVQLFEVTQSKKRAVTRYDSSFSSSTSAKIRNFLQRSATEFLEVVLAVLAA